MRDMPRPPRGGGRGPVPLTDHGRRREQGLPGRRSAHLPGTPAEDRAGQAAVAQGGHGRPPSLPRIQRHPPPAQPSAHRTGSRPHPRSPATPQRSTPSGNHLHNVQPGFCYCPAVPPSPVHACDTTDPSAHRSQSHGRRSRRSRRRRPLGGRGRSLRAPRPPPRRRRPRPHGRQGEGRRRALHRRVREADRQPAFAERLHGPPAGPRVPGRGTAPPQHVAAELREDPAAGKNFVFTRLDTSHVHVR